jgi:hypothetical protein
LTTRRLATALAGLRALVRALCERGYTTTTLTKPKTDRLRAF